MDRHRKRFLDPHHEVKCQKRGKPFGYKSYLEPDSLSDSADSEQDQQGKSDFSHCNLSESENENDFANSSMDNEIGSQQAEENNSKHGNFSWANFKTYGSKKLYDGAPLDFQQSYGLILAFSLRFGLSFEGTTSLLQLINAHLPMPSLETTKYKLFSLLKPILDKKKQHHVCSICKSYIGETPQTCSCCNGNENPYKSESFVSVSVKDQLKGFFCAHPSYISFLKSDNQTSGKISDVVHSYGYQKLPNADYQVSLMVSTDGVQLFNSSKQSLWPISFLIAELPPRDRIKHQFVYTVWAGLDPPIIAMFEPFIKELSELEKKGITLLETASQKINVKVKLLQCINDTPGRSKVQGLSGLRGESSCGWCTHKGEIMGGRVFPMKNPMPPLRSNEIFVENVKELISNNFSDPVNGISSLSPFYGLPSFDMTKGFPIDYMHCVLQGMVKHILYLWTCNKFKYEQFSIHHCVDTVNDELSKIRIPHFVARLPRLVDEKLKWKSNEFKNFLLYYSLPLMKGKLRNEYYVHYAKLVHIIYEALKDDGLSKFEIDNLQLLINEFLYEFEYLYGKENLRYNFHLFYHLMHSYEHCGPLWTNSMFPFESKNQIILRFITGTKGVSDQCMTRFALLSALSAIDAPHPLIEKFLTPNEYLKKFIRGSDSVTGLGPAKQISKIVTYKNTKIQISEEFRRVAFQNRIYTSFDYDHKFRRCNSVVQLKNNIIGELLNILYSEFNNRFYAVFRQYEHEHLKVGTITFSGIYTIKIPLENNNYIISVDNVKCGCVCVKYLEGLLCCVPPNTIESD